LLLAGGLLLPAATDPPEPLELPATERVYTLKSEALTITPDKQEQVTHLLFSKGVTVAGEGISLSADTVELDVKSGEVGEYKRLKLPKMPEDPEHIVREPSQTIAEMGGELQLPEARFSQSSLREINAAGHVRVESEDGIVLTTEGLKSTDGGRAWVSTGRSLLQHVDEQGNLAELSADVVQLNTESRFAEAIGNIEGSIVQRGIADPVEFKAQKCTLELQEEKPAKLAISENLVVWSGVMELHCELLTADLGTGEGNRRRGVLEASGSPLLIYGDSALQLTAETIQVDLPKNQAGPQAGEGDRGTLMAVITARGGVTATIEPNQLPALLAEKAPAAGEDKRPAEDQKGGKFVIDVEGSQRARLDVDQLTAEGALAEAAQLTAGELLVDLRGRRLTATATGEPQLTFGSSSYSGQKITLTWEDEQTGE